MSETLFPEPERRTRIRGFLLLLLLVAWAVPGLVGHDPWKPDEAGAFGIVYHIVRTGEWLVPVLAGEVKLEYPPLFYLSAALMAKLFHPWLALHDGARLAAGMYMAVALLFSGLAARELIGRGAGWINAVMLIGCLGLLVRGHQLVADIGMLAGLSLGLYGLALAVRRPLGGGLLLGIGAGVAFMSKGYPGPLMLFITALALLPFEPWRNRHYAVGIGNAARPLLPWLLLWPIALNSHAPALFDAWFQQDFGRLLAGDVFVGEPGYFLRILPWFAWPALPLALWALWQARASLLSRPALTLPLIFFIACFVTLSTVPDARDVMALPLLLPLALLATATLDTLRRGASGALDWFGIMTFGLLAAVLWLGWIAQVTGSPARLAQRILSFQPAYVPEFRLLPFALSLFFTLLWIALVRPARRSNRRAIINWGAGITLVWLLAMTLWLPLIDTGKSYRGMITSLTSALPDRYRCIASQRLGEPQRAMLHYFADIVTKRVEHGAADCDLLLVQSDRGNAPRPPDQGWELLWEGSRPGDRHELFRLYTRKG